MTNDELEAIRQRMERPTALFQWIESFVADAAKMVAEVDVLRCECERLRLLLECKVEESIRLKRLEVTPEGTRVELASEFTVLLGAIMADVLRAHDAQNLVEATLTHDELGPLTLTIQRKWGKSAMDLRNEAMAEVEQLKAQVAELEGRTT